MKVYGLQVEGSPPGQPSTNRFRYLWAKQVSGFRSDQHCANCLIGPYVRLIRRGLTDGVYEIPMEAAYFYLCGVTETWAENLHLAVRPEMGSTAMIDSVYGVRFTMYNAARVPIPELPLKWRGLPRGFTSCRNFQFGVAQFGYRSPLPASPKLFDR